MKRVFHYAEESHRRKHQAARGWEKYCFAGEGGALFIACLFNSGLKDSL